MKDIANCPRCGAIFVKTHRPICHNCYIEQEKNFEKVSTFIRKKENRMATLQEVHEKTGVDLQLIHQFIREGRLLVHNMPNITYPCESCGKPIREGRLCATCRGNITEGLKKLEREKKFAELVKRSQEDSKKRFVTYHSLNDRLKRER